MGQASLGRAKAELSTLSSNCMCSVMVIHVNDCRPSSSWMQWFWLSQNKFIHFLLHIDWFLLLFLLCFSNLQIGNSGHLSFSVNAVTCMQVLKEWPWTCECWLLLHNKNTRKIEGKIHFDTENEQNRWIKRLLNHLLHTILLQNSVHKTMFKVRFCFKKSSNSSEKCLYDYYSKLFAFISIFFPFFSKLLSNHNPKCCCLALYL